MVEVLKASVLAEETSLSMTSSKALNLLALTLGEENPKLKKP